ncbi:hypothetical protein AB0K68_06185 [Streptomyces sp. NPDC050698]
MRKGIPRGDWASIAPSTGSRVPSPASHPPTAPMGVVATVIGVITRTGTGRRPRPPSRPKSAASTGRKKIASPNDA